MLYVAALKLKHEQPCTNVAFYLANQEMLYPKTNKLKGIVRT